VMVISAGNVIRLIPLECSGGLILIFINPTVNSGSGIVPPANELVSLSNFLKSDFSLLKSRLSLSLLPLQLSFPVLMACWIAWRRIIRTFASCFDCDIICIRWRISSLRFFLYTLARILLIGVPSDCITPDIAWHRSAGNEFAFERDLQNLFSPCTFEHFQHLFYCFRRTQPLMLIFGGMQGRQVILD
jgi:hypothetical protein